MAPRAIMLLALLAAHGVFGGEVHDLINAGDFDGLKEAEAEFINEKGPGGQTPLMMAVLSGKDEAVRILLERGADTSIGEEDGCALAVRSNHTPCHGAGFQGRAAIMQMLIKHGLPCTTDRHKDGFTPLHRACWGKEQRHADTVRVLLKAGAPPDQAGSNGKKPIEMTSNAATKKLLQHRLNKQAQGAKSEL